MSGDGLELAVKLRNQDNPLAAALWYRLVYAEDPDAEADRIRDELAPMVDAATKLLKAAMPAIRAWYDAAGPN